MDKKLLDEEICDFLYEQDLKYGETFEEDEDEDDIRFAEKASRDARRIIESL